MSADRRTWRSLIGWLTVLAAISLVHTPASPCPFGAREAAAAGGGGHAPESAAHKVNETAKSRPDEIPRSEVGVLRIQSVSPENPLSIEWFAQDGSTRPDRVANPEFGERWPVVVVRTDWELHVIGPVLPGTRADLQPASVVLNLDGPDEHPQGLAQSIGGGGAVRRVALGNRQVVAE